ncbi:hypothetical protein SB781_40600, partial [Paraburkholderia sp. SIMBA_061]
DAAVILLAVALTAAIQLSIGLTVLEVLRASAPLAVLWFLMLGALHTRDAALFQASATEYRGVANASGLAFGLVAIID